MDVLALGVSLGAMRLATTHPSSRFTFGLRRAEPLAAIVNGALVLAVAAEIVRDAVNCFSAWVLHGAMHVPGHSHGHAHHHQGDEGEGHAHDHGAHLNLRGAWLHLLGDALGSVAAFVAGLLIRLGVTPLVDPIASLLVVVILLIGAMRLLRDAAIVLLDAAPKHLPVDRVKKALLAVKGIRAVHALHVWTLGTGHDCVTAHVVVDDGADGVDIGARAAEELRNKLLVEYVTVQVERRG
jgi:cation diffusion facilitator family transporter